jgi:hypothetical protein
MFVSVAYLVHTENWPLLIAGLFLIDRNHSYILCACYCASLLVMSSHNLLVVLLLTIPHC